MLEPPRNPLTTAPELRDAHDRKERRARAHDAEKQLNKTPLANILGQHRATRRTQKEILRHARKAKNARGLIDPLPKPGEAVHAVINGTFDFWHIVPALIELTGARCDRLDLATLGFNKKNITALLRLIDDGAIGRARLVCSVVHQALEPALCKFAFDELTARGGRFLAARNHAKVFCFDMAGGAAYTVEGSANLRSCGMAEQFMMTSSRDLLEFHNNWIDEITQEEAARERRKAKGACQTNPPTKPKLQPPR